MPIMSDVESFLTSGGDKSKGGSFLGWRKDKRTLLYLHRTVWCAKVWIHTVPVVKEIIDKETEDPSMRVWSDRWMCHEPEALLMKRFDRLPTGERSMPPTVCPQCLLPEVVKDLVARKELSWIDPLFRWDGDIEEEQHIVLAGGVYNGFSGDDIGKDPDKRRELKAAGVRRKEAWNQSLLVKQMWLFCVCDPANIEAGILKTFEAKSLGEKMKKAIADEMKKARDENGKPNKDFGNPLLHPFPFEWNYDEEKDYEDKYDVVAMTGKVPSPEVLEVIGGPAPDITQDTRPGNCWWLKDQLESHYVGKIKFPWERVFGPAERAGLMKPPSDTKDDEDEDDDDVGAETQGTGRPPEIGQTEAKETVPIYVVGPEHDVWFDDAKEDPKVKGALVELETPSDDPPTAAVTLQVVALLKTWGAKEVAIVVDCDHCGARMTDHDIECAVCHAEYGDDSKIIARPCLSKALTDKAHRVPCDAPKNPGPIYICETCGAMHELASETAEAFGAACWTMKAPPPAKVETKAEAPAQRKRRGMETAAPETPPPPAQRVRRGVPFDSGKKA